MGICDKQAILFFSGLPLYLFTGWKVCFWALAKQSLRWKSNVSASHIADLILELAFPLQEQRHSLWIATHVKKWCKCCKDLKMEWEESFLGSLIQRAVKIPAWPICYIRQSLNDVPQELILHLQIEWQLIGHFSLG